MFHLNSEIPAQLEILNLDYSCSVCKYAECDVWSGYAIVVVRSLCYVVGSHMVRYGMLWVINGSESRCGITCSSLGFWF